MADHSLIEWTDATWQPITGCSVVSPGCTNCYAMKLAGTRLKHHPSRQGLTRETKAGPVWNGEVRLNEQWLDQPLRWKQPRRIFVCAHGDLFAEGVPDEWIDKVFGIMALAPHHTFQVLTKRAARMREYLSGFTCDGARRFNIAAAASRLMDDGDERVAKARWPLPNVWLGVSAEDQARADERIPHLLQTPAAVRFVSAEPLLGPIDLTALNVSADIRVDGLQPYLARRLGGDHWENMPSDAPGLDWVIVGGESGPDARPMHPDWVRSLRDQCAGAGVAFFMKQWGSWAPGEWHFDLQDHVMFEPLDPAVPVEGLSDHERAQHRVYWWDDQKVPEGLGSLHVGKKAAGRLLDGVDHNAMPEVSR